MYVFEFWNKVKKTDGCWVWVGGVFKNGYGCFRYKKRTHYAHRFMLEMQGVKVDGKVVLHSCDNPNCVNPAHLIVGTHQDNIADKVNKGRQSKGETHGRAKLTDNQIQEIRACLERGEMQKVIAARYGVTQSNVSKINTGNSRRLE